MYSDYIFWSCIFLRLAVHWIDSKGVGARMGPGTRHRVKVKLNIRNVCWLICEGSPTLPGDSTKSWCPGEIPGCCQHLVAKSFRQSFCGCVEQSGPQKKRKCGSTVTEAESWGWNQDSRSERLMKRSGSRRQCPGAAQYGQWGRLWSRDHVNAEG